MVFRFGKFLARSITATRVPISGPSKLMSAKMPAVWPARPSFDALTAAIPIALVVCFFRAELAQFLKLKCIEWSSSHKADPNMYS